MVSHRQLFFVLDAHICVRSAVYIPPSPTILPHRILNRASSSTIQSRRPIQEQTRRRRNPADTAMSPRDPIITRSRSARARADAAATTAAIRIKPPHAITKTRERAKTTLIATNPAALKPTALLTAISTNQPKPKLPSLVLKIKPHPYPAETHLEPTAISTPTPFPDGNKALFDLALFAIRHSHFASWDIPETEVILFTVAALGLLYGCRLAYRSVRHRRSFRRSGG